MNKDDLFIVKEVLPLKTIMNEKDEYVCLNENKSEEQQDRIQYLLFDKKELTEKENAELHILCLLMYNQTPNELKKLIEFVESNVPKDVCIGDEEREIENILNNKLVKIRRKE